MDKYYLRLLGSVSNSRGIDCSIQRTSSSFVSSYSTVSYFRPTEVSTCVEGSRYSFGKEGSGGSSCIDRSRILFSSLPCSEEDRGVRPIIDLPILNTYYLVVPPLQNGDQSFYQSFDSSKYVDHFPGSFRCLFPYSYLPFIPQIPSFCLGQQSLPIQSFPFRLSTAPLVFTKVMQTAIFIPRLFRFIHIWTKKSDLRTSSF